MAGLRGRALVAYLIVCVFWGSTYLAIKIGVGELPPFLFAGLRFLTAGVLLLGVFVLDRLVESDGEQIERKLQEMAAGVTAHDYDGVFRNISDSFLVNGVTVATALSAPYAADYTVPASLHAGSVLQVRALATDTSGNAATSDGQTRIVSASPCRPMRHSAPRCRRSTTR